MKTTTLQKLQSAAGCVCFSLLIAGNASAQLAGDVDANFGIGGYVTSDFDPAVGEIIQNTITLSNDKIALVGYTNALNQDILIARLNADGSVDSTFGTNGKVIIDASLGANDEGFGIAETNDGKLLVSGITVGQASWDAFVMRLNEDGSTDFGFGNSGTTLFNAGSNLIALANEIYVNPDNSFYVGASVQTASNGMDFALFKFTQGGVINQSFGSNGSFTYDNNGDDEQLNAMYVNANGNVLLAGNSFDGSVYRGFIVRTSSFGTLDSNFDGDGKLVYDSLAGDYFINDIIETSYGKIVAVGSQGTGNNLDGFILQLNINGSYDTNFSDDGLQYSDVGASNGIHLWKVMELNGNLLTTGEASGLSMKDIYAYMLTPTGAGVGEFSNGDVYVTPPSSLVSLNMRCATIQSDGKVIIAGDVTGQDFTGNNLYAIRLWTSDAAAGLNASAKEQFSVYPNPAQHAFHIQAENALETVSLLDLQGRTVQQWNTSTNYELDAAIGNGVFVLQVQTAKGISAQKIQINR